MSKKGYKQSKKHKEKLKESRFQKGNKINLGRKLTEKQKEKIRLSLLGKKHTEKTRKKQSEALKGKAIRGYGWHHSEITIAKMSKSGKGKLKTEETKRKISKAKKGKKLPPFTEKHKNNIKKALKGKFVGKYKLEENPNWQGGKSFEPYSVDWTKTLKRAIKERDRFTCQVCGEQEDLMVHHIDYNKKNCNSNNLITLCRSCHSKTNYNRDYWTNYFKLKI